MGIPLDQGGEIFATQPVDASYYDFSMFWALPPPGLLVPPHPLYYPPPSPQRQDANNPARTKGIGNKKLPRTSSADTDAKHLLEEAEAGPRIVYASV